MSKIRKVEYPFSPFDILIKLINTIVFTYLFVLTLNLDIPIICSVFIALTILCFIVGIVDDVAFLIKDIKRDKLEDPTEEPTSELEAHEAFGASLDDTAIRMLIRQNKITELRELLKILGNPKIEYQEYDFLKIVDDNENSVGYKYKKRCTQFFNSSCIYGEYKELNEFEKENYKITFNWYDYYHYNKVKKTLYYSVTYCELPKSVNVENIANDETYIAYEEIMEHITKED